jgi:hypothetical protein
MKKPRSSHLLVALLATVLFATAPAARSQGILGIGGSGIIGLPDTTHFGDTIPSMGVWLKNEGFLIYTAGLVTFLADPNNAGSPINIGLLNLTGLLLLPGDSVMVSMDPFIVTPQNSNTGSNIMVIWPTTPGSQPGDSGIGGYYVDAPMLAEQQQPPAAALQLAVDPEGGQAKVYIRQADLVGGSLRLVDLQGSQLQQVVVDQPEIVLSMRGLAAGIYLIDWVDPLGQRTAIKFVWAPPSH